MHEYDDMSIRRELILVIIILTAAAIFFLAGLVHLILRLLAKTHSSSLSSPSSPAPAPATFRQRQLRQLFRLHDDSSAAAGLDRAVVEALPVFRFDELRNCPSNKLQPFDCPVCLCEFSARDELRLLPGCGHAFHVSCVDTWLVSNATCPLCRRALFAGDVSIPGFDDDDETPVSRVFSVRLGKFESSSSDCDDDDGESTSGGCNNDNKLDDRRCYSMGTFRYVVGESDLRVTSSRFFGGKLGGEKIGTVREKGESFSVSKIWLRLPGCSDTDIRVPAPVGFPANGHRCTAQRAQV